MAKSGNKFRRTAVLFLVSACVLGGIGGCGFGKGSKPAESVKTDANADTKAPELWEVGKEFPLDQRVYAKEMVRPEDEVDPEPKIRITGCDGGAEVASDGAYVIFKNAGTYNVELTAEDSSGNAARGTMQVTAYNKVLPEITLQKEELELSAAVKAYDFSKLATAKSSIYGDLTNKIKVDDSQVTLGKAGTYKVVYSVEDQDGNKRTAALIVKIGGGAAKTTPTATPTATAAPTATPTAAPDPATPTDLK